MRKKQWEKQIRRIEGEERTAELRHRMIKWQLKIAEKDDQISWYTLTAMSRPGPVEQILKEADRKVPWEPPWRDEGITGRAVWLVLCLEHLAHPLFSGAEHSQEEEKGWKV